MEIDGKKLASFTTVFDFPVDAVTRGFWTYCKDFARLQNLRSYYRVAIPPADSRSSQGYVLYGKPFQLNGMTEFYLALDPAGLENNSLADLQSQVKNILREFKVDFYFQYYQEMIDFRIKEAEKLSKRYHKKVVKEKEDNSSASLLRQISELETGIRTLRAQQLALYPN